MAEKYRVVVAEERMSFWGGQNMVRVMHIDGYTTDGFPFTVEIPIGEASKDNIDSAIQERISYIRSILQLGM